MATHRTFDRQQIHQDLAIYLVQRRLLDRESLDLDVISEACVHIGRKFAASVEGQARTKVQELCALVIERNLAEDGYSPVNDPGLLTLKTIMCCSGFVGAAWSVRQLWRYGIKTSTARESGDGRPLPKQNTKRKISTRADEEASNTLPSSKRVRTSDGESKESVKVGEKGDKEGEAGEKEKGEDQRARAKKGAEGREVDNKEDDKKEDDEYEKCGHTAKIACIGWDHKDEQKDDKDVEVKGCESMTANESKDEEEDDQTEKKEVEKKEVEKKEVEKKEVEKKEEGGKSEKKGKVGENDKKEKDKQRGEDDKGSQREGRSPSPYTIRTFLETMKSSDGAPTKKWVEDWYWGTRRERGGQ